MVIDKPGIIPGITINMIAEAILSYDDFHTRALTMEWLYYDLPFVEVPRPETDNPQVLIMAAVIVELLALRANQTPPAKSSYNAIVMVGSTLRSRVESGITNLTLRTWWDARPPWLLNKLGQP